MVFNNKCLINKGETLYTEFSISKNEKIKYLSCMIYALKGFSN